MILTDYYKMAKLPNSKSKLRFDCVASTGGYEPFEQRAQRTREKRFKFYYGGTPDAFKAEAQRKADMAITDTTNISSVYVPDLEHHLFGYGDVEHTNDALLFLFNEDYTEIEIFIARGYKNEKTNLFNALVDGGFDDEIARLREQAEPTNAVTK